MSVPFRQFVLQPGDVFFRGHIDDVRPRRPARCPDVVDGGPGTLGVDFGDFDMRAMSGEETGDRPADAGTAAGHQGHLAGEKAVPVRDGRDTLRGLRR